jgi:hypothetical protein
MRLGNGVLTVIFFPFLYNIYRNTRRRFYLLWGTGFLLYGGNILTRAILPLIGIEASINAQLFSFALFLGGFVLIITGIGDLVDKARTMLLSAMVVPFVIAILYFTTQPYVLGRIVSLSPFLFISISLFFIRRRYSASLDLFVVGWAILLLDNIALAVGMRSEIFVEVFAMFGKVIIFMGMTYPKFSFLVDDFRRFLISGVPEAYAENNRDRLILVNPTSGQRSEELRWIKDKIDENKVKAVRTIFVTTYDLISSADLASNGINENDLYLVRMLTGGRGPVQALKEHVVTIKDDMNELDVFFTDIMFFSNERKISCQIIVYTVSALIHTHGWKRVYSFLLSKMSQLKASNVQVYGVYYPETHAEKADIMKFEKMADKILLI